MIRERAAAVDFVEAAVLALELVLAALAGETEGVEEVVGLVDLLSAGETEAVVGCFCCCFCDGGILVSAASSRVGTSSTGRT